MKVLIISAIIFTLAGIFFVYRQNKDMRKLLVALATVGALVIFAIMGNISKQVVPLFIAHIVLLMVAWGGLIVYLFKDRYYWWVIFSPLLTIGLFLVLEFLTGSRHEGI